MSRLLSAVNVFSLVSFFFSFHMANQEGSVYNVCNASKGQAQRREASVDGYMIK